MKTAIWALVAILVVGGCAASPESDNVPAPVPVAVQPNTAGGPTAQQQKAAADAEQMLKTLRAPIYAGATVDALQSASSDGSSASAVFTTPASLKQVEYFYNSYPELKPKSANGTTVYSGSLAGAPMVIEIRPGKDKTEIIIQARQS